MDMPGERDKHAWRAEIIARRAAITNADRETEARELAHTIAELDVPEWVCAYVPVRGEPGSTAMLMALRTAGARVLLPITGPPGPLQWAEFTSPDELQRAGFGLLEPTSEVLADAITLAELILVPALAVDRRGVRLGRGAGYYDRTLPAARPTARLIAVVRDDELLDQLPEEPHDLRMGWALTPHGGLHRLGSDRDVE
ncbi:5-formyltetrahydrofolate cyclo-ligase [Nocardia sp. NPDC051990]|uniref:5-formyltetrahydrofolate cyclo-ligase n=1 Tax=Nocardia sp. NPDC051990 TaxID=3155285 RepID=UPI00341C45FA